MWENGRDEEQLYLHSPVPVDLARLGILHVLHLLPAQSVQNLKYIFGFFVSSFLDPIPLTLVLHVPHPIDGPLSSKNIIFSTCFSKTQFSSYQLLDLLELLWVCVDGHELVVVLDLGGVRVGRGPVGHPLQVRQSSEASSWVEIWPRPKTFFILWATSIFLTIKKRIFLRKRSQDDCLTSSCAPIQNPKMRAALKMKSLWFWFFIRFIQQTSRSGQKYAMLTAQSSSCIR